jgi:hypothetical protein
VEVRHGTSVCTLNNRHRNIEVMSCNIMCRESALICGGIDCQVVLITHLYFSCIGN